MENMAGCEAGEGGEIGALQKQLGGVMDKQKLEQKLEETMRAAEEAIRVAWELEIKSRYDPYHKDTDLANRKTAAKADEARKKKEANEAWMAWKAGEAIGGKDS